MKSRVWLVACCLALVAACSAKPAPPPAPAPAKRRIALDTPRLAPRIVGEWKLVGLDARALAALRKRLAAKTNLPDVELDALVEEYKKRLARIHLRVAGGFVSILDQGKAMARYRTVVVREQGNRLVTRSVGKDEITGRSVEGVEHTVTLTGNDAIEVSDKTGTLSYRRVRTVVRKTAKRPARKAAPVAASPAATTPAAVLECVSSPPPAAAAPSAPSKEECVESNSLAQDHLEQGRFGDAREELLECANAACGLLREECARMLGDVDKTQPSVVFEAKTASGEAIKAVTVKLEGEVLTTCLDGKPVLVDPGERAFRFEARGFAPFEKTYVIIQGAKGRREAVVLKPAQ
jgi:hypothetical protein